MADSTVTKILFRRGSDADRQSVTLAAGEPGFTTDTKELYIGDGVTAGGIKVGASSTGSIVYKEASFTGSISADKIFPATSGGSVYLSGGSSGNPSINVINSTGHGAYITTQTANKVALAAFQDASVPTSTVGIIQADAPNYDPTSPSNAATNRAFWLYGAWAGGRAIGGFRGDGAFGANNYSNSYLPIDTEIAYNMYTHYGSAAQNVWRCGGAANNYQFMRLRVTTTGASNHTQMRFESLEDDGAIAADVYSVAPTAVRDEACLFGVGGDFAPAVSGVQDLGSPTLVWRTVYRNTESTGSDLRLKTNIKDLTHGLTFINRLRPVEYVWKNPRTSIDRGINFGLIAQEVEDVVQNTSDLLGDASEPCEAWSGLHKSTRTVDDYQLDSTSENYQQKLAEAKRELQEIPEYYGLEYIQFIAPLIKAVQELSAEVDSLKAQLAGD